MVNITKRRAKRLLGTSFVQADDFGEELAEDLISLEQSAKWAVDTWLYNLQKIYVAPNGDDDANGDYETPLASLTAARNYARTLTGKKTIIIREGKYRLLDEPTPGTISLTSADNDTRWVVDGAVEITAGSVVTNWTPTGTAGVWVGDVEAVLSPSIGNIDTLNRSLVCLNGIPQQQNRYPKWDPGGPGLSQASYAQDNETAGYLYMDTAGGTVAYAVFREADVDASFTLANCPQLCISAWAEAGWAQRLFAVSAIDHTLNRISYYIGTDNPSQNHKEGDRYWLENIPWNFSLAPLNEGEFYIDMAASKIYFRPRTGDSFNPATDEVTVPRYEKIFDLNGCKSIGFEGITFTDNTLSYSLNGAVHLTDCTDCYSLRCTFTRGGSGWRAVASRRCQAAGCTFRYMAGTSAGWRETVGTVGNNCDAGCFIGNLVEDVTLRRQHDPAVEMASDRGIVRFNTIRRCNFIGLMAGLVTGGLHGGGISEYNIITDYNRQGTDSGAGIYGFAGFGTDPGVANWIIRYNSITVPNGLHTVDGTNGTYYSKTSTTITQAGFRAIYPDNNCCNWIVYGNYVNMRSVDENGDPADIGDSFFFPNDSTGHVVFNNIFVGKPAAVSHCQTTDIGIVFLRNIIYFTRLDGVFYAMGNNQTWWPEKVTCQQNFYYNPNEPTGTGAPYTGASAFFGRTLAQFQSNEFTAVSGGYRFAAYQEQRATFTVNPLLTGAKVGSATLLDPDVGFVQIDKHIAIAGHEYWEGRLMKGLEKAPGFTNIVDIQAAAQGSYF